MNLIVTPVNDDPTSQDSQITVLEDTRYSFSPSDFPFEDVDGDLIAGIRITQLPNRGNLRINGGPILSESRLITTQELNAGGLTYLAPADEFGNPFTSFGFKVSDGTADSESQTMAIRVDPVDDPPFSSDTLLVADEDIPQALLPSNFSFTDIDTPGPLAAVRFPSLPQTGSLTLSGNPYVPGTSVSWDQIAAGDLIYQGQTDLFGDGVDSFPFAVQTQQLWSQPSMMNVDLRPVNDPPVAEPENYQTAFGETLIVPAGEGVLINDSDIDSSNLFVSSFTQPTYGTVDVRLDGGFTYTPRHEGVLDDAFTYEVSDGALTTTGTVTVSRFLQAAADQYDTLNGSFRLRVDSANGVLANEQLGGSLPLSAAQSDGPDHGTLTLNVDGSLEYIANADYVGTDSFTYTITNGLTTSVPQTVSIDVRGGTNMAYRAVDDAWTDAQAPFNNYGISPFLRSDSVPQRYTFLKFDVSDLPGVAFGATLHLHVDNIEFDAQDSRHSLHLVENDAWSESNLRWSNQPVIGASITEWTPQPGQDVAIDLRGVVADAISHGDPTITLAISSNAQRHVDYVSSEHEDFEKRPRLVVATDGENRAPIANADSYETLSNQPLQVSPENGVLANDVEPDGEQFLRVNLHDTTQNG
ncbi:MAG: Ig-like domain-containing protein, partial [Planctomycetota bacterium]